MAVKTFTSATLSSADTNTYLANAGLVYITEKNANSGSTMSIDNCFTSTYASYLVTFSFIPTTSAFGADIRMRAGTDTITGYNYGITAVDMTAGTSFVTRQTNANVFPLYSISDATGRATSVIQIANPQLAQFTAITAQSTDTRATTGYSGVNAAGMLRDTTQYNGISFILGGGSGTISFMTAKIYGYRQA
jgi:hypothetical protein